MVRRAGRIEERRDAEDPAPRARRGAELGAGGSRRGVVREARPGRDRGVGGTGAPCGSAGRLRRSNVPAEDADALRLAEWYRKPWAGEAVFREIPATRGCATDPRGHPPAALFAFCLALPAANAVSVRKAAPRAARGAATVRQEVPPDYLALAIRPSDDGRAVALAPELWQPFRRWPAGPMAARLARVAQQMDLSGYRTHPRGPKKPPPTKAEDKTGGHVPTAKLLGQRRRSR